MHWPGLTLRGAAITPCKGARSCGGRNINTEQKPPRVVGLAGAILINLNAVIGAGIFALPALLYASAGSFSPIAVLVFAALYSCLVAVSAKLSTVFRQSGGPQLYAQHAFGPAAGFQIGWFSTCANMAASAANMHVLVSYLAAIFPFFGDPAVRLATILLLIIFFMCISISGTNRSIKALSVGTFLKLAPVLLLCVAGLAMNGVPTNVVWPQFSEFEAIAILLAYAFSGSDMAVVAAGETKNPRGTIMRSIFLNMAGVALFYAFVMWAYDAIGPDPAEVDSPLAAAGYSVFGQTGVIMISLAAIFSIATFQLNVFVAMPRMLYGMARRGLMPNFLAYVSPRFETPAAAIATYAGIIALLAVSGTFAILAAMVVAVDQLLFTSSIGALLLMWRRNDAGLRDTMDARWLVIIPVAIGMVIWLIRQVPLDSALSTLAMIAVGVVLYFLSKRGAVTHEGVILPEMRS